MKSRISTPEHYPTGGPRDFGIGEFKVILKGTEEWRNFDRARVQISVPAHPAFDPRTRTVLDWSMKQFGRVTLCLHDTIQRYNFMSDGLSEKEAYQRALTNGDLWLANNVFEPSDASIEIIRWELLTSHPDYQSTHARVCNLYENNSFFAEAINFDINTFAERCLKRGESFPLERVALSRALLLEEISGYILLYREESAADLFQGMRMKAMQLLLNGLGDFSLSENVMVSVKTSHRKVELSRVKFA